MDAFQFVFDTGLIQAVQVRVRECMVAKIVAFGHDQTVKKRLSFSS
jgi:hypothetical protein